MNETITNYAEADALLGSRDSRKIAHNTYAERLHDGTIGVRLHSTYVVRFRPDGTLALDSGGWQTVTIKERINRYLPPGFKIGAHKRVWFLHYLGERVGEYEDGLVIDATRSRGETLDERLTRG